MRLPRNSESWATASKREDNIDRIFISRFEELLIEKSQVLYKMTPAQNRTIYFELFAAHTGSWNPARSPKGPEVDKMEGRNEQETPNHQTPRPALSPRQQAASSCYFLSH